MAAQEGHEAVVELLLDACPESADARTPGWTALHYAAREGHEKVVDLLMSSRPELLEVFNPEGQTALHCALTQGRERTATLLLQANIAQASDVDRDGNTVLHHVVGRNQFSKEFVERVFRMNTNALYTLNKQSLIPLQVAVRSSNWPAVQVLMWHLSLEDMVQTLVVFSTPWDLQCFQQVMIQQCEGCRLAGLKQEVYTIFEYLGVELAELPST